MIFIFKCDTKQIRNTIDIKQIGNILDIKPYTRNGTVKTRKGIKGLHHQNITMNKGANEIVQLTA